MATAGANNQAYRPIPPRLRPAKRGGHGEHLDATLLEALELLAADVPLPSRYVDHSMKGQYSDCRDCHLRPELVLV